ncbi:FecR domain-containing protein [Dyella sp. ASV21]|jgi:transmembrane sensor|uniref:FecR family protein n=1 Tax=Dyella sp. ASV21 TaxID=2795114 RepID=UPI0018ED96AA|nr:FecR domain-containing protein [Dyella sp. ASV21]
MMANTPNEQTLRIAADWWMRLSDPAADERTTAQWLAWTDEDSSHLLAFERVTELATRLGQLGEVTRTRLLAEFAPTAPAARHWRPWAAAAAVMAMLLSGYFGWAALRQQTTTQVYASGVASRRDLTLDDGSRVSLGGATRVTTRFSHDQRQVELAEGEAYFEVAHNEQRPFVVHAGKITIEDVGTAFDVRRTGDRVTIAMAEGKVRIFDGVSGTQDGFEAVAGDKVSYDPQHPAFRVTNTNPSQIAAWRDARLEFDNEPLSVVVANINRYSEHPVRIVDADLAPLTFTGTVRTDAINDWLYALPEVLPLQVREEGGQVLLSHAKSHAENTPGQR